MDSTPKFFYDEGLNRDYTHREHSTFYRRARASRYAEDPLKELDNIEKYMHECNKSGPIFTDEHFSELNGCRQYRLRDIKIMNSDNLSSFIPPNYSYTLSSCGATYFITYDLFSSYNSRVNSRLRIWDSPSISYMTIFTSGPSKKRRTEPAVPPTP